MPPFRVLSIFLLTINIFTVSVNAEEINLLRPLYNSNNNPLTMAHDTSNHLNQSAMQFDSFTTALNISTASISSNSSNATESISLDGEISTLNLQLAYKVSPTIQLSFSSSVVRHSGGNLDGLIEEWHDLWGLPNGNRNQFRQNQLHYHYENNDQVLINFDRSTSQISDSIVSLGWSFAENQQWLVQTAIKLPTGSASAFSGSGHFAASFSLAYHRAYEFLDRSFWTQSHLGIELIDKSDLLPEQIKSSVVFANINLAWQASHQFALKMQLNGNTEFYESGLTELGKNRLQLLLGGSYQLSKRTLLDFSFSEDLTVNASPDVTFYLGLQLIN